MKKVLGLIAMLALVAGYAQAQSAVTVTNRGEVITVYTMEDATMGNASATADTTAAFAGDVSVGDDLTVTDDAAVGGDVAVTGAATVGGTLAVTGVATFTAAPTLTATNAVGSETATLSNAPAAGNPVLWGTVTVGTNTYVIPLFASE